MESPVRTSFIPKQAVQVAMTRRTQPVISIFTVIGIFVFLSAVAASGGVFLYKKYLIQEITKQETLLTSQQEKFKLDQIKEWRELDLKIKGAKQILTNHVAPSRIFHHLEENTLANVRFIQFDLQKVVDKEAETGSMSLKLEGEAPQISTIVVQSDHFGSKRDIFSNPFFHNIRIDQTRKYIFSVEAYVPANELRYSKRFDLTESADTETTTDIPLEAFPQDDSAELDDAELLTDTPL